MAATAPHSVVAFPGTPPKDWPHWRRDEFLKNRANGRIGGTLVSETDRVRVWHIALEPGQRLPFHRHVLDYFWSATSNGRGRSHYEDGQMTETVYKKGDTRHIAYAAGESMIHDLENVGDTVLSFVTVEFKVGANQPLPF